MLGAMWVCWRTGPFWPADAGGALAAADPLLCLAAAAAFVYGLVAPTASLLSPAEREFLTPDRQNLLVGSVVQNVIGATFLPVVLCLAFRGEPWWLEVHERCGREPHDEARGEGHGEKLPELREELQRTLQN